MHARRRPQSSPTVKASHGVRNLSIAAALLTGIVLCSLFATDLVVLYGLFKRPRRLELVRFGSSVPIERRLLPESAVPGTGSRHEASHTVQTPINFSSNTDLLSAAWTCATGKPASTAGSCTVTVEQSTRVTSIRALPRGRGVQRSTLQIMPVEPVGVDPDSIYELELICTRTGSQEDTFHLELFEPDRQQPLPRHRDYFDICAVGHHAPEVRRFLFRTLYTSRRVEIRLTSLLVGARASTEVHLERAQLRRISGSPDFQPPPSLLPARPVHIGMATHAGRLETVADSVLSVYPFAGSMYVFCNGCDRRVPAGLDLARMPRLRVFFSEDWDDLGDAGKFFRMDELRQRSGWLHATVDDDMLFPLDFLSHAERRLRTEFNDSAILGVHCVMMRQPLQEYNDLAARKSIRVHIDLASDVNAQIVGTAAILYSPAKFMLEQRDFVYPNMADLFVATAAQKQGVPRICMARHAGWVQNVANTQHVGIWAQTQKDIGQAGARRDEAQPEDMPEPTIATFADNIAVPSSFFARRAFPVARTSYGKLRVVLGITTWNRLDFLQAAIESWVNTRSKRYDWTLIVADDGSTDGTVEWLQSLFIDMHTELFVLLNKGQYVVGQTNAIFELASIVGFDVGFKVSVKAHCRGPIAADTHAGASMQVDDDVVFTQAGWDEKYVDAMRATGMDHICYLNVRHRQNLVTTQNLVAMFYPPIRHPSGLLEARVDAWNVDGPLFTFTPRMLQVVGYGDEANFPIRGQWHVDITLRAARAGLTSMDAVYDVVDSNKYIELQVVSNRRAYCAALPWGAEYAKTKTLEELARRRAVMSVETRIFVPLTKRRFAAAGFALWPTVLPAPMASNGRGSILQSLVDAAVVLNLDGESGRLDAFVRRAGKAGVRCQRLSAVGPHVAGALELFERYMAGPSANATVDPALVPVYNRDFYTQHTSQIARAAFIERNRHRRVFTRGGLFYLLTWQRFLFEAAKANHRAVVLFDDDAVFHREFDKRLREVLPRLPEDWMVVYLGAMQYDYKSVEWEQGSPPADFAARIGGKSATMGVGPQTFFYGRGSSIGSHAVLIRDTAYLAILRHLRLQVLPVDDGALSTVCHTFPRQCVTLYPHLVIQDLDMPSSISSSVLQEGSQSLDSKARLFRWNIKSYIF